MHLDKVEHKACSSTDRISKYSHMKLTVINKNIDRCTRPQLRQAFQQLIKVLLTLPFLFPLNCLEIMLTVYRGAVSEISEWVDVQKQFNCVFLYLNYSKKRQIVFFVNNPVLTFMDPLDERAIGPDDEATFMGEDEVWCILSSLILIFRWDGRLSGPKRDQTELST